MSDVVESTVEILTALAASGSLQVEEIDSTAKAIYQALKNLDAPQAEPRPEPAVSIRASVKPDYIVCLEDGKKLKMLKRYLATRYGLTPEAYRERWGLAKDYPMVAPNYAAQRRALAKSIGLGQSRKGMGKLRAV
ncbi:MAG: MucR family transcriptional regulator [Alphaproteobacteria bacterium]|jgi:predicted transcriptional regulator|nr:MucR family transcriptional regulator [Alphaproteobacteria bacterium]